MHDSMRKCAVARGGRLATSFGKAVGVPQRLKYAGGPQFVSAIDVVFVCVCECASLLSVCCSVLSSAGELSVQT